MNRAASSTKRQRREGGSALIIAMMMLALMGVIGLAALDTVTLDQQVASFQSRKRLAFYAAEAGVAEALATLESAGVPDVQNTSLGDTSTFPYGQPTYGLDTSVANPIESVSNGNMDSMNLQLGQGGTSRYTMQIWRMRVQGQEPAGSISRIEVSAGRFQGN